MASYNSIESWASRLGYVVERCEGGYVWHPAHEQAVNFCATSREAMEKILEAIKGEYKGGE